MRPIFLLALLAAMVTSASAQTKSYGIFPFPKAAFGRGSALELAAPVRIVVPDAQSPEASRAAELLRSQTLALTGIDLAIIPESQYTGGPAVIFAQLGVSVTLDARIRAAMPPGEPLPPAGGYVIDASSEGLLVGAADAEGLFSAVSSLRPLTAASGSITGVHVWDYPDYPVRWVFNMQNLRAAGAVGAMRSILDTMQRYKLNAIQQNDFKYSLLQMQPDYYFDSVRAYRALSEARGIGIVPGVAPIGYSEGILWNDANLAEGFPATSRYVIEADTARLVPDARVALPNGGFENVDANGKLTGWSYFDEATVSVDRSIMHSGSASARCSNFAGVNSRFIRGVQCRPHSAYVLTAWLRTEQLKGGELRLLAIGTDTAGGSRVLAHTAYGLSGTSNGWKQVQVVFNTLEYARMNLYVGLWGGGTGTFWVDDFEVRENGLANVLRRGGTPLHVKSADGAMEYREGADFAPVADTRMASGIYPWHQPPTFRRLAGGSLRNGDSIDIAFFHPVTTYGNEDGIGQNMVCLSEDTLYSILRDQFARVDALYSSSQYLMQHDEVRVLNRDSACLARNLSPAELLADNVTRCATLLNSIHPGVELFTWSDMFDSLHNAVDDYFLVNGDLRGIWNMIPRSITIGNWNSGQMRTSLDFFSALGFEQIAAPYYDERDTRNIRAWRLGLEPTPGAKGMLYTTWVGDYSYLKPFSYYVWGAGPNMMHTPLDSTVLLRPALDSVRIDATVWADPYDNADRVGSVVAHIDFGGSTEDVTLVAGAGGIYTGWAKRIGRDGFSYSITARNDQGLERTTPSYVVARAAVSGIGESAGLMLAPVVRPNPLVAAGSVTFVAPAAGAWHLSVIDPLGRIVTSADGSAHAAETVAVPLDASGLARGAYRCEVRSGASRRVVGFVVP
jgi:hypothetical protein